MQSESSYPSIANHLRRIIPAFILSNFLPFLQIWLGVEFSHFSKELKRAGEKPGDETLGKIVKYFLAAGVLTIITFVCWLIPVILPYATQYLSGYTIYILGYGYELRYVALFQYMSIALPAITGIIQTALLFKAWTQIRVFFSNKDQQQSYRSGGVIGAGRVIWAMQLSGFAYALIVTGFILLAVAFGLNASSSVGSMLTGFGEVLTLAGLINQCVGMAQTARGFQNLGRQVAPVQYPPIAQPQYQQQYQSLRPQYQAPPAVYTPAPVAPQIHDPTPRVAEAPRPRFCTGCGVELPVTPGLKFCPTCGSKL